MRRLKMLGLAAVAAMAFAALAASSASATALEVEGWVEDESVTIEASLKSGTSMAFSRTDASLANTCTESLVKGDTESPFIGTTVTGAVGSLSFGSCTKPVTIHKAGTLQIQHTGTTNATVSWSGAEVTVATSLGFTVNCKTGAGVDIGTLTGKKEGNADLDINAVLNCGFLLPSAKWEGTYAVTSPRGLGVVEPGAEEKPKVAIDYPKQILDVGTEVELTLTDKISPVDYTVEKAILDEEAGEWKFEGAGCGAEKVKANEPKAREICKVTVKCLKKGSARVWFYLVWGGMEAVLFKSREINCV